MKNRLKRWSACVFRAIATLMLLAFLCSCAGVRVAPPTKTFDQWLDQPMTQLPNQWSLKPAGDSIPMGDLPLSMTLSPDGRYLAVVHSGYGQHEIAIVSLETRSIVDTAKLKNTWLSCAFTPDGRQLIANGGWDDLLYIYDFTDGKLNGQHQIVLHDKEKKNDSWYPAGIAVGQRGQFAYVAMQYGNRLMRVDLNDETSSPTVVCAFDDNFAYPYKVLLARNGKTALVSLWGGSSVASVDLESGQFHLIPTDPHPNDMVLSPDEARLFVACGNTNRVDVIDLHSERVTEVLDAALFPNSPDGSTPNSLALDSKGKTLLVANADNNDLAVFDISTPNNTRPIGFIPVGWYPTAVAFAKGNRQIIVANGKGEASRANPKGPQPDRRSTDETQYIGGLFKGTLSIIQRPDENQMKAYTQAAYACCPMREDLAPVTQTADNPIPAKVGDPSPIEYCVYIIRENRTYDQVFGDMPEGDGDPELCLFPEKVTPNSHELARRYVLLDRFFVDAEVSADGHEWTMGAYATDYTEKSWPTSYGGHAGLGYPSEGENPVSNNEAGYLWDRAAEAGVSYRSYGEWIGGAGPEGKGTPNAKSLEGHFNPYYTGWDMHVSDIYRAEVFLKELDEFNASGEMPRLIIMRLPNDHTLGTRKGELTSTAYVAQNDLALGMIVEGLSKSPFWPKMAIFVLQDDAQNGPDHIDAHRSPALLIGPYVKRQHIDHTMYSTTSVLRSIELILGLKPMSQYDAGARPMYNAMTMTPDLKPFTHIPAKVDLEERNGENAPMQKESAKLRFDREDANDDILFNRVIWASVKGKNSVMPAPVRTAAIRPIAGEDGDED